MNSISAVSTDDALTTPRPLLEVRGISCNYDLERAVFDLSLTVHRGEQVCLLGPSGCGKTTVLRAIAGFHSVLTGGIFINNRQVSAPGAMVPPEARRVGMVFQDHALFPHLSVRQNVASGLRSLSAGEQKTNVDDMLDRMDISRHAEKYPHELSGGQQQRVAIARALALEPKVVICDESVSMLDAEVQAEVLSLLRDLQHQLGLAMIFVTHDLSVASGFCHRVIVLDKGRIVEEGPGDRLFEAPQASISRLLVEACPRLPR
ncbi:MAG TPA: hypothetical protein DCW50_09095 [Gammaproteobacteria bacterium]|nr:hypothetical protein [Gammaproteobacteria bacterium]